MTIEALQQTAGQVWNTTIHAAKSWIKNSPIIYAATAATYYGSLHAAKTGWIPRIDPTAASKFTFLTLSVHALIQGLFEQEKPIKIAELENRNLIILTNTAAISLAGLSYFKVKVPVIQGLLFAGVTSFLGKMLEPIFATHTSKQ